MSDREILSPEKMILNTDPEAAREMTITGWVSRNGLFFGKDERAARWSGCTHIVCECGKPACKSYTCCEDCRAKRQRERWEKFELVKWDGESPLTTYDGDDWFFDADSLYEWAEDNDIDLADAMLVIAEPCYARTVDEDYWSDDLHEDSELPSPIVAALKTFNEAIKAYREPLSWHMGKQRVIVEPRS